MVSKASDDLPEPLRPVITVRVLRGISTLMFFRLCWRAPRTLILVRPMDNSVFVVWRFRPNSELMYPGGSGAFTSIPRFEGARLSRSAYPSCYQWPAGTTIVAQDVSPGSANLIKRSSSGTAHFIQQNARPVPPLKGLGL